MSKGCNHPWQDARLDCKYCNPHKIKMKTTHKGCEKVKEMSKDELLELAWGLIANANEGDWDKATPVWKKSAIKWRDEYHRK